MKKQATSKELTAAAHQHHLAGRFDEAEAGYRKALREDAGNANAHYLLGTLFLQRQDPAKAARSIGRAIQLSPGFLEMHVNLSVAYQHMDMHPEAVDAARRALDLDPNNPDAYKNLGDALNGFGDPEGAFAAYQTFLHFKPNEAMAHVLVGNAFFALGQDDAALHAWEDALVCDPHYVAAHGGIAEVLSRKGWFHATIAVLKNAIAVAPNDPETQKRLGLQLIQLGRLAEGWATLEKGRFRTEPEKTVRRPEPPAYWNGEDLTEKRILIWTEQGLGDEILHGSMIPEIIARAGHCTIECTKRMAPVFARSFPTAKVVAFKAPEIPATNGKDFDYQTAVASLGCFLRNDFAAFPHHQGYLRADPNAVGRLRKTYEAHAGGRRIVGIAWKSKKGLKSKSASLTNLEPILKTPGILFVNLQYGDCAADLAEVREKFGVEILHDPTVDPVADVDAFFAQVAAMDLVVSSSNTTVHVAGSQNIPTLMMLEHGKATPYYWFLDREMSPWYPSIRIFRSSSADTRDSWEAEPAVRIGQALSAWMTNPLPAKGS